MIKVFLVTTSKGFGIGITLVEAKKHYEEHNGKLKGAYTIDLFDANAVSDITVDMNFGNWHSSNYAKHLSHGTFTA